jgi:hypothetical protein
MSRRREHDGDLGLASDQIPGQKQNNIRLGLVTLPSHHQAFRGDTRNDCTARLSQKQAVNIKVSLALLAGQ